MEKLILFRLNSEGLYFDQLHITYSQSMAFFLIQDVRISKGIFHSTPVRNKYKINQKAINPKISEKN